MIKSIIINTKMFLALSMLLLLNCNHSNQSNTQQQKTKQINLAMDHSKIMSSADIKVSNNCKQTIELLCVAVTYSDKKSDFPRLVHKQKAKANNQCGYNVQSKLDKFIAGGWKSMIESELTRCITYLSTDTDKDTDTVKRTLKCS